MFVLLSTTLAWAHVPELYVVGPEDDWCRMIDDAQTGDIVMLQSGEYEGPCTVEGNLPDYPGEILTVQAFDLYDPPVLVHGGGEFILELTGQNVMLSSLLFDGVPAGSVGVSVEAEDSTVRFSTFTGVDGVAVSAGKAAGHSFVNDCTFFSGSGTAVEIGCADGGCSVTGFEVVDNLVLGLGTGLVVHPTSAGSVVDNTFDVTDLGIQIAGRSDAALDVSSNLVRASVGLSITGGPTIIRNNLVLSEETALRSHLDEAHGVQVIGNTLVGAVCAATSGWTSDDELASNALQGTLTLAPEASAAGNVACDVGGCWLDPVGLDYFPALDSPLREAGVEVGGDLLLGDWCGRARATPPTAGALEAVGEIGFGPLEFGFKRQFDCTLLDPPVDTGPGDTSSGGTDTDTDTDVDTGTGPTLDTGMSGAGGGRPEDDTGSDEPRGKKSAQCGCGHAPGTGGWMFGLMVCAVRFRTRGQR